ncbi:MAG: hypothetical protein JW734_02775 [Candidatus Omnitrophica bacterium]|nr:hypothetical protein [Candidatus Omnitrophota bacterium]
MVELLVVLVIIGILAAVVAPMYFTNVRRARAAEAVAVMGMMREAEREYFVSHNQYLNVTNGNLSHEPGATSPGLSIDIGVSQYFAGDAFNVTVNASSTRFTDPDPVNFVIAAKGNKTTPNVECNQTVTEDCAVKASEVNDYLLEMDNSGRIFVCYAGSDCSDSNNWSAW